MVSQGHLPHDDDLVDKVRAALLSGHEHQGEKKKGLTAIKSVADFMARRDSDSHLKTHGKKCATVHLRRLFVKSFSSNEK